MTTQSICRKCGRRIQSVDDGPTFWHSVGPAEPVFSCPDGTGWSYHEPGAVTWVRHSLPDLTDSTAVADWLEA